MTLQEQFAELNNFLARNGLPFLVVGGLAVQHYGYSRATMDVDVMLVVADDSEFARKMRADGFDYFSITPMVILGKKPQWSQRVDFLKVDEASFSHLASGAAEVEVFGVKVMMPSLPHLIAMKFHSYRQGGFRRMKDLNDIVWLALLNNLDPDHDLREAALKYAGEEIYQEAVKMFKACGGEL